MAISKRTRDHAGPWILSPPTARRGTNDEEVTKANQLVVWREVPLHGGLGTVAHRAGINSANALIALQAEHPGAMLE